MIKDNLQEIIQHIATTAKKCGRDPKTVRLVAVSKRFPTEAVAEASQAGQYVFGENYIQEAQEKKETLGDSVSFHFIGHLQTNKAKIAAEIFDVVETIDRLKLAKSLSKHLVRLGRTMIVLIQVNIGNDPNKSGVSPEETEQLVRDVSSLPGLEVRGLMTMPPITESAEKARHYFKQLRELSTELSQKGLFPSGQQVELSMGMSSDYPVAIEEGATIIRIGTAIFGQRPLRKE